jgi:predicted nucleic acid-binding protein
MKPRPSRKVIAWAEGTAEALMHLSVITIGEVRKRIDLLPDHDPRRAALQSWLDRDVRIRFAGRLLAFDDGVAGDIAVTATELRATFAPLSSPHRTAALAARTGVAPLLRSCVSLHRPRS